MLLCVFVTQSIGQSDDQQAEPISIINDYNMAMALVAPSTAQIDSVIQLSYRYLFVNQDSCLLVAQKALLYADKYRGQKVQADAMLQLGDAYRIRADLDKAVPLYIDGRKIYMALDLEGKAANADTKLGALYKEKGEYEAAIDYHLSAMKIWEAQKDTTNVFKPYINISEVFYLLGRKDKALEYNSKALQIAEAKNYTGVKMVALSNQGTLQKEMAIDYKSRADALSSTNNTLRDSAEMFYHQALESYAFSLDVAQNGNNKRRESSFLYDLADLELEWGNYAKAIELGQRARDMSNTLGSKYNTMQGDLVLTKAYRKSRQTDKAIRQGAEALKVEKDKSTDLMRSEINYELYLAYRDKQQYQKALMQLEEYKEYHDQADHLVQNKIVSDVEAKYQTAQKKQQILQQQNDILLLEKDNTKISSQRNYILGSALSLGLLGFLGLRLNKIRRERNDKIEFNEALIYAQEEERKRIARDLHDGIGQSLLLIKKQMASASLSVEENQKLIGDTLAEVRAISQELHPFQLEKFGLAAAIEDTLEKVQQATNIFITHDIEKIEKSRLTEKININLFRTIQEAISNVVKHAQASAIKLTMNTKGNMLFATIQDNGSGFDHAAVSAKTKSLGLRTMYERISTLGGTLRISKGDQKGTRVEIAIPIG